jgi:hypothetical protein
MASLAMAAARNAATKPQLSAGVKVTRSSAARRQYLTTHPLEFIQVQLSRHQNVADALFRRVNPESDTYCYDGIGLERFNSLLGRLNSGTDACGSHLGLRHQYSRSADESKIEIDAPSSCQGSRRPIGGALKNINDSLALNSSRSDKQDIGTVSGHQRIASENTFLMA